ECGMRPQKPVRERFLPSEQAQYQVLRFNIRTSELARLVSCEEDNAARFLGITFKHSRHRRDELRLVLLPPAAVPETPGKKAGPSLALKPDRSVPRTKGYESRRSMSNRAFDAGRSTSPGSVHPSCDPDYRLARRPIVPAVPRPALLPAIPAAARLPIARPPDAS